MTEDSSENNTSVYQWRIKPRQLIYINPFFTPIFDDETLKDEIRRKLEKPDVELVLHDNSVKRILPYATNEYMSDVIESFRQSPEFFAGIAVQHLERLYNTPEDAIHINLALSAISHDVKFWTRTVNDVGFGMVLPFSYDEYYYLVANLVSEKLISEEEEFYQQEEYLQRVVNSLHLTEKELNDGVTSQSH